MTSEEITLALGLVVGLGVSLQWLARLVGIPGILLLLPAGVLVGRVLGLVDPEAMFGGSLFPLITIGVGLLLLQGGFLLRVRDLQPSVRGAVTRLVTIGVAVTLAIGTIAVLLLLDVPFTYALLLGALLVVSGPTVVGPILSLARPRDPVGPVLRWEGIVIDPIGASLGVAALSYITAEHRFPLVALVLTVVVGVAIGLGAAGVYVLAQRSGRIPPRYDALVGLMLGVVAIVSGELAFSEAGLFAATAMGLAAGNQRLAPTRGLRELTETIEPLIIGSLFILLAALVELDALRAELVPGLALVGIYVLLARPLVALLATHGLGYDRAERAFIGAIAPRGIVAAASASLFAISLQQAGTPFPELVPMVFLVVIGTVAVYGLAAVPVARVLGVTRAARRGIAIVGDQHWASELADCLAEAGVPTLLASPGAPPRSLPSAVVLHAGPLTDLADDTLVDDAHEAIERVAWAIVTTADPDRIALVSQLLVPELGHAGVIALSRGAEGARYRPSRAPDALARTPFGLFGRDPEATLDALEAGAGFAVIGADASGQAPLPPAARPFLRLNADDTLAVPASADPLREGERLVVVAPPPQ